MTVTVTNERQAASQSWAAHRRPAPSLSMVASDLLLQLVPVGEGQATDDSAPAADVLACQGISCQPEIGGAEQTDTRPLMLFENVDNGALATAAQIGRSSLQPHRTRGGPIRLPAHDAGEGTESMRTTAGAALRISASEQHGGAGPPPFCIRLAAFAIAALLSSWLFIALWTLLCCTHACLHALGRTCSTRHPTARDALRPSKMAASDCKSGSIDLQRALLPEVAYDS